MANHDIGKKRHVQVRMGDGSWFLSDKLRVAERYATQQLLVEPFGVAASEYTDLVKAPHPPARETTRQNAHRPDFLNIATFGASSAVPSFCSPPQGTSATFTEYEVDEMIRSVVTRLTFMFQRSLEAQQSHFSGVVTGLQSELEAMRSKAEFGSLTEDANKGDKAAKSATTSTGHHSVHMLQEQFERIGQRRVATLREHDERLQESVARSQSIQKKLKAILDPRRGKPVYESPSRSAGKSRGKQGTAAVLDDVMEDLKGLLEPLKAAKESAAQAMQSYLASVPPRPPSMSPHGKEPMGYDAWNPRQVESPGYPSMQSPFTQKSNTPPGSPRMFTPPSEAVPAPRRTPIQGMRSQSVDVVESYTEIDDEFRLMTHNSIATQTIPQLSVPSVPQLALSQSMPSFPMSPSPFHGGSSQRSTPTQLAVAASAAHQSAAPSPTLPTDDYIMEETHRLSHYHEDEELPEHMVVPRFGDAMCGPDSTLPVSVEVQTNAITFETFMQQSTVAPSPLASPHQQSIHSTNSFKIGSTSVRSNRLVPGSPSKAPTPTESTSVPMDPTLHPALPHHSPLPPGLPLQMDSLLQRRESLQSAASATPSLLSLGVSHRRKTASPALRRRKKDAEAQCELGDSGFEELATREKNVVRHHQCMLKVYKALRSAAQNLTVYSDGFENELMCKYCYEVCHNPVLLWPCGHTFCKRCIDDHMVKGELWVCAECRGPSREGYTPNLVVQQLATKWDFRSRGAQEPKTTVEELDTLLDLLGTQDASNTTVSTVRAMRTGSVEELLSFTMFRTDETMYSDS